MQKKFKSIAVLVDGDNCSPETLPKIFEDIEQLGTVTVRRVYGNFSVQNSPWKAPILKLALKPMQQFAFTTGKNATDGLLIIDAMDLLYSGRFDAFCIISSDSDFTSLAIRLKESGIGCVWIWAARFKSI